MTKKPTKFRRFIPPDVDWKTLGKNDEIKVVKGHGNWVDVKGAKHYTGTPGGKYIVHKIDENGIQCYDGYGYCYIYMGPEKPSPVGGIMAPHKIKLIRRA